MVCNARQISIRAEISDAIMLEAGNLQEPAQALHQVLPCPQA